MGDSARDEPRHVAWFRAEELLVWEDPRGVIEVRMKSDRWRFRATAFHVRADHPERCSARHESGARCLWAREHGEAPHVAAMPDDFAEAFGRKPPIDLIDECLLAVESMQRVAAVDR